MSKHYDYNLPETSGWDVEAKEHRKIQYLYYTLCGVGVFFMLVFGLIYFFFFLPIKITGNDEVGRYEYSIHRYVFKAHKQEIFIGSEIHWDSKNHIIMKQCWKNNLLNGSEETWYESGQLRSRCYWFQGKKDGLDQYFHSNGKLAYGANWNLDELKGIIGQNDECGNMITISETLILNINKSVLLELILIPNGEFMMGSDYSQNLDEKPVHKVVITNAFYMGRKEVTQEQYECIMGENPSFYKSPNKPVERVSWNNASIFCEKISSKLGISARLPTEAEWEYSCRAGSTEEWCFGNDRYILDNFATYHWLALFGPRYPGQKRPNNFGLYDMHGNVREWCSDWYDEAYYLKSPSNDPLGPEKGSFRVSRGGCWFDNAYNCRSACRIMKSQYPQNDISNGFRIVVSIN